MFQHQDKYKSSSQRGFTLVEALVSLALLVTALVPTYILAVDAVKLSTVIRNSLIATNLGQEGVETVRAMRDANWFATLPFGTGLDTCSAGCRVQWDSQTPLVLAGNPALKLDPASGLYQYTTGTDSPFKRKITIVSASAVELVVKSEVTWNDRSIAKTVVVEYHLYDWLQ